MWGALWPTYNQENSGFLGLNQLSVEKLPKLLQSSNGSSVASEASGTFWCLRLE
jgi:hypothetical protein